MISHTALARHKKDEPSKRAVPCPPLAGRTFKVFDSTVAKNQKNKITRPGLEPGTEVPKTSVLPITPPGNF